MLYSGYTKSSGSASPGSRRMRFATPEILLTRKPPKKGGATQGRHFAIITRLVHHENFAGWPRHFKNLFGIATGDRSGAPVTVALYCRSGKHRGAATALILQHVLRAEGWDCIELARLSSMNWGHWRCNGRCNARLDPERAPCACAQALATRRQI